MTVRVKCGDCGRNIGSWHLEGKEQTIELRVARRRQGGAIL